MLRPADEERHVEIIQNKWRVRIVEARLSFGSDDNRIGKLPFESDDRAEGLQVIGQGGAFEDQMRIAPFGASRRTPNFVRGVSTSGYRRIDFVKIVDFLASIAFYVAFAT